MRPAAGVTAAALKSQDQTKNPAQHSEEVQLSICIVTHNTRDLLRRTLEAAVQDAATLCAELIVVDNASGDGSAEMVRSEFPQATLVANEVNRYYSAANNQAMALSRGRYVLVLNSDAEIQTGTLPELIRYLDSQPEVGAVSAAMVFPDGRIQRNCSAHVTYPLLLLDYTFLGIILAPVRRRLRQKAWYGDWNRLSEREVDVIPGAFMLVRREVIRRIGGFDEQLRLYFAEDDWCRRIQVDGWAIRYVPVGRVTHPEGSTVRQNRREARRLYFEDLSRYARKWFGVCQARLLMALAWPTRTALDLADSFRGRRR